MRDFLAPTPPRPSTSQPRQTTASARVNPGQAISVIAILGQSRQVKRLIVKQDMEHVANVSSGPIDAESFVKSVYEVVYRTAIDDVMSIIQSPPGRAPEEHLVRLNEWFLTCDENERRLIKKVAEEAAQAAIFGMLCVFDGVRAAFEDEAQSVHVAVKSVDPAEIRLLPDDHEDQLHDIFQSLILTESD